MCNFKSHSYLKFLRCTTQYNVAPDNLFHSGLDKNFLWYERSFTKMFLVGRNIKVGGEIFSEHRCCFLNVNSLLNKRRTAVFCHIQLFSRCTRISCLAKATSSCTLQNKHCHRCDSRWGATAMLVLCISQKQKQFYESAIEPRENRSCFCLKRCILSVWEAVMAWIGYPISRGLVVLVRSDQFRDQHDTVRETPQASVNGV